MRYLILVALLSFGLNVNAAIPSKLVASNQERPQSLITDGTRLFWINQGEVRPGEIMAEDPDGGKPILLATAPAPQSLVYYNESVYWSEAGDTDNGGGSIRSVSANGD